MSFVFRYDVANRCLQHLGQPKILTFADLSMQANETSFIVDKVRRAELRRAVWTFATRRMILRPKTSTFQRITFPVYSATQAYTAGDVVQDSTGYLWLATAGATGTAPGTEGYNPMWVAYFGNMYADTFSTTVQYFPGDMVVASSVLYLAIAPSLNQTPPNTTYWHALVGSPTLSNVISYSPTGYALQPTTTARSAFYLPANFMRLAAQDPKAPGTAHNTVTAGMKWSDWEIENQVLYSAQTTPLVIRFVADVQDVTSMDDMFCEGWGARMAMGLNERFTSNKDLFENTKDAYESYMNEARAMASIEAGSTEDDFQGEEQQSQPQAKRPGR